MFGLTLPPFLAKYGFYLLGALIVAGILGLAYCEGHKSGKSGEVVQEQKATIKTQQEVGNANENAASARVADTQKSDQQGKELSNALQSSNDPNRARIERGCVILRQQHRDTKNIPACRGSSAGK
jgi:hypothetical protein